MRKRIIGQGKAQQTASEPKWLDLGNISEVEVSSEDPGFPIESALTLDCGAKGWRAAAPGEQLIRIIFEAPIALRRIRLEFEEIEAARTQEFVLRWSRKPDEPLGDIVRQQWNFSPNGSTSEVEDYQVNLDKVGVLELAIKPDISGGAARASLTSWRLA